MAKARLIGLVGCLVCAACQDLVVVVGKYDVPGAGHAGAAGVGSVAGAGSSGAAGTAGTLSLGSPARVNVDTPDQVSVEPGTLSEFCAGRGIAVRSVRSGADCATRLERRLFSHALCSCNELSLAGDTFLVDSYDSSQTAYVASEIGGSIGTNGALISLAPDTRVLGSAFIAGPDTLGVSSPGFVVSGDLKTNGRLEALGTGSRIARDLWIRGDVRGMQDAIAVGRDVYQQSGHTSSGALAVAGRSYVVEDLDVPAPCACDSASLLDVAALVEQARTQNDNEAQGFSPDALKFGSFVTSAPMLPCGRLFVNGIAVTGDAIAGLGVSTIDISARQRTALFVDGDVSLQSLATLNLGTWPDAGELDVFIRGDLVVQPNSTILIGSNLIDAAARPRPAAVRVFVAGNVITQGSLVVWGQLYAPHATIDIPAPAAVVDGYGSIFASNIRAIGTRRFHFDRAITRAGNECSAPAPQRCDGCHQCPDDRACIDGSCAACASDADCCAPAVCSAGRCRPLASDQP